MVIVSDTCEDAPAASVSSAPGLRVSAPYTPDPDDHELAVARQVLTARQFAVWYAVERLHLSWFAAQKHLAEQGQPLSRATLGRELTRAKSTLDQAMIEAERAHKEGVAKLTVIVCKGGTTEEQTDRTAQAAHDNLGWRLMRNFGTRPSKKCGENTRAA